MGLLSKRGTYDAISGEDTSRKRAHQGQTRGDRTPGNAPTRVRMAVAKPKAGTVSRPSLFVLFVHLVGDLAQMLRPSVPDQTDSSSLSIRPLFDLQHVFSEATEPANWEGHHKACLSAWVRASTPRGLLHLPVGGRLAFLAGRESVHPIVNGKPKLEAQRLHAGPGCRPIPGDLGKFVTAAVKSPYKSENR